MNKLPYIYLLKGGGGVHRDVWKTEDIKITGEGGGGFQSEGEDKYLYLSG